MRVDLLSSTCLKISGVVLGEAANLRMDYRRPNLQYVGREG